MNEVPQRIFNTALWLTGALSLVAFFWSPYESLALMLGGSLAALNFALLVKGTSAWFFGNTNATASVARTLLKYGLLGLILFAALAVLEVRIVGFCVGLSCLPLAVMMNIRRMLDDHAPQGQDGAEEGDE